MMLKHGLYPPLLPFRSFRLAVDPPHELHVEEGGDPAGIPVLALHGGPGSAFRSHTPQSFHPGRFRVVRFDQRGCGRSTPLGCLDANTTEHLVADIERVREALGIERWLVTGASWGCLLALVYGLAHPDRCLGFRLQGVQFADRAGIRAWFHDAGRFFPEAYEAFAGHVPEEERGDLVAAYHRRLVDPDPAMHEPAARALRLWLATVQVVSASPAYVFSLSDPVAARVIGTLITHYCLNGYFVPEGAVLAGIGRLRHLPCEIVQGRIDMVTAPEAAWRLKAAWPGARLTVVDVANHVATPEAPDLSTAITEATDRLADRLEGRGPALADYLALASHQAPTLSDDGTLLAWIADETGSGQIWTMARPGGRPSPRLILPDPVTSVAFRPKSRDILFTTDGGGDERTQLWLLRDGQAAPEPLTQDPRVLHAGATFDPPGQRLVYAANARTAADMDIHLKSLETGETRVILAGQGWRTPMKVSPDGTLILVQDNGRGLHDADLLTVEVATGEIRPLLSRREAHVAAARFVEGGAALLLVTDAGRAFHGLARLPLAGGALEWLATPEGDVEAAVTLGDDGHAAVAVNRDGVSRILIFDLGTGESRPVEGLPAGRVTSLLAADGGRRLVVALARFDRPSAILEVDLDAGAVATLAAGAHPLAAEDTVVPMPVAIPSFDGATVPAFLFEPAEPRPGRPALVFVHGGPESQFAAHWRPDLQYLVRRGWTVLAPNVRGSTGYGRAWQAGDDLDRRMDSVRDLEAVRAWLAAQPGLDAARICVAGQSYGGFMALSALAECPDHWCAGADFYGIADFPAFMATTGPWRRRLRAVEYGDPDTPEGAALLASLSPLAKLDRIRAPLFLAHGLEDPRVSPAQSEAVASVLRGRGHPVTLVRVADEGHGFRRAASRRLVFDTFVRFLEAAAGVHEPGRRAAAASQLT
ncbi:alpha/beta fold hydrolase [Prosthecomicrobium sp. N25]|uniref:alpha/beta fold hydrolase n=1 Tax=Prosthecomicrobium sp. N25 TaxID=3129254 RepID=UPI003076981A